MSKPTGIRNDAARIAAMMIIILLLIGLVFVVGHVWPGLVAAALAGYWIARRDDQQIVEDLGAHLVAEDAPEAGPVVAIRSLGRNDIKVIRHLRAAAGLTVDQCRQLAMTPPASTSVSPIRLSFPTLEAAEAFASRARSLGAVAEVRHP